MPRQRGKATKSCQTDTVFLTEDQVENIVAKSLSHMEREPKQIKHYDDLISKLQKEIEDLKSTVNLLVSGTDALNNLQQRSDADIELLQDSVESIEENQIKASTDFNMKFEENEDALKLIDQRVDCLEQDSKASNIRILGIDEEDGEDLKTKVMNLAQNTLHVTNIGSDDITDIGRMGKKRDKVRDILVKFRCSTIRDKIYNKRKLLRQEDNPIYVNEDLTPHRSKLFFEARKLRKREKIFGTWTHAGNIMVKVKDSDQPSVVRTFFELSKLIQNENQEEIQ